MALTKEQLGILDHTSHLAASGLFCGDSSDMQTLVRLGLMRSAGWKPFVPEEYFCITGLGRKTLKGGE